MRYNGYLDNGFLREAFKKRAIFYSIASHQDCVERAEHALADVPRTLDWCGPRHICVGYKKEYFLVNVLDGVSTELTQTGRSGNALTLPLPQSQVMVCRDNISVTVNSQAKQANAPHSWSAVPQAMSLAGSFLVASLPSFIEVQFSAKLKGNSSRKDGEGDSTVSLAQSVNVRGARITRVNHCKECGIQAGGCTGGCDIGCDVYAASGGGIWRLISVSADEQVEMLLERGQVEAAKAIASTHLATHRSRDVHDACGAEARHARAVRACAHHYFQKGRFSDAMNSFASTHTPIEEVIGLFPQLGVGISSLASDSSNTTAKRASSGQSSSPHAPLTGARHIEALAALRTHLEAARFSAAKPSVIVDTALLRVYLKLQVYESLTRLLKGANACDLRKSEQALLDYRRYGDLVELYRSKGQHKQALELLARAIPDEVAKEHSAKIGETCTCESCTTVVALVDYLRCLDGKYTSVVVEYSTKALRYDSELGVRAFTVDHAAGGKLDHAASIVYAHIQKVAPEASTQFLQWCLTSTSHPTTDAELHDALALRYLADVRDGDAAADSPVRSRLLQFLESSRHYQPERLLHRFPSDDLFEERAVLLGRIGRHEAALRLLVDTLDSPEKAERYCRRVAEVDPAASGAVYLALFTVYLSHSPSDDPSPSSSDSSSRATQERYHAAAFALLNRHYRRIDSASALDLLPDSTPVSSLYPFFEAMLRNQAETSRRSSILRNLLRTLAFDFRRKGAVLRGQMIRIDHTVTCSFCQRRVGTAAFAYHSNGTVVHYMCMKQSEK